jgi:hypothetical protein
MDLLDDLADVEHGFLAGYLACKGIVERVPTEDEFMDAMEALADYRARIGAPVRDRSADTSSPDSLAS